MMEKHSKKDIEKYSKDLRDIQKNALKAKQKQKESTTMAESSRVKNSDSQDIITKLQEKAAYHEQKAKEFYTAIQAVKEALAA